MLRQSQEDIRAKGFNIAREEAPDNDFAKMRVGIRTVDDVLINLGSYRKVNSNYGDKKFVLSAIYNHNTNTLREISNYFYESSGIYYRACKYLASLYRYDWYVTPYIESDKDKQSNKFINDFAKVLQYLDNSNVKRLCDTIALDIIKEGAYYGIIADFGDKFGIQKLPCGYCRSRFYSGVDPVVELNLRFFDDYFYQPQQKLQVLKTFPLDIQKAYVLYKEGKLKGDIPGSTTCWVALEPDTAFKLSLSDNDFPMLIGSIPSIIDLDQAQDLDRKKTMQQLLKILVQKLPLDKNGDLIFDVDEAKDIHDNAVAMLKRAVGIDVLTTFADVEKIDTKDSNSATTTDDLEKAERTVYNGMGISKNIFNAEGNTATTNSILADEAAMRDIPLLLKDLFNRVIQKFNRKNHYNFKFEILGTTQFNYRDLSKIYKEQAQMGYSKMLTQIALGQSQADILATMMFENEVLNLADIMIPPKTSNTMSSNDGGQTKEEKTQTKTSKTLVQETKQTGRPQKDDTEKSDKTIANEESIS